MSSRDMNQVSGDLSKLAIGLRFRSVRILERMNLETLIGIKSKVPSLQCAYVEPRRSSTYALAYQVVDMDRIPGTAVGR